MIRAMLKRHVPLRRLGTEAEVSAAIVFLLSPAAAFITGVTLRVDGARRSLGSPMCPPARRTTRRCRSTASIARSRRACCKTPEAPDAALASRSTPRSTAFAANARAHARAARRGARARSSASRRERRQARADVRQARPAAAARARRAAARSRQRLPASCRRWPAWACTTTTAEVGAGRRLHRRHRLRRPACACMVVGRATAGIEAGADLSRWASTRSCARSRSRSRTSCRSSTSSNPPAPT